MLFKKILFIYFYTEGKGGRERERNINVWLSLMCPLPGTWPVTQACILIGNWTSNPLVCRLVLNPLSHTSQASLILFKCYCIPFHGYAIIFFNQSSLFCILILNRNTVVAMCTYVFRGLFLKATLLDKNTYWFYCWITNCFVKQQPFIRSWFCGLAVWAGPRWHMAHLCCIWHHMNMDPHEFSGCRWIGWEVGWSWMSSLSCQGLHL